MTRRLTFVRWVELLAVALWLAAYVDDDTFGLAGTVAGSVVLLAVTTEWAHRLIART